MENESYYISEEEFYVLLAGKNIVDLYSLALHSSEDFEKDYEISDINRILAGLYQKNLISWEDDYIVLESPVKELLKIIEDSKYCICLNMKPERMFLFYISGGDVACLEASHTEYYKYRVTHMEVADLQTFFVELGVFPENPLLYDEEEEAYLRNDDSYGFSEFTASNEIANINIVLSRGGVAQGSILVVEEGIDVFLIVERDGTKNKIPYTPEHWMEVITSFVKIGD